MLLFPCRPRRALSVRALLLLLLPLAAGPARAQSGDAAYPTPIFSNEVTGRIAPRDIGDPRRTRHFYTFRGTEGDLVVTLERAELNGDVDVFTAGTLRPLLKITLFGGPTTATKSVFLRREETLVLRVEARAAAETEGSYRIRLGGSFAPAPAGLAEAPAPALREEATAGRRPGTRRVTSTGARIEEPPTPAEEAGVAPSPTPSENAEASPPARAAEPAEERPATSRESTRNTRRGRNSNTSRRRGRAARTPPAEAAREGEPPARADEGAATNPPAEAAPGEAAEPAPRPSTRRNRGRGARRNPPRERPGDAAAGESSAPATPEAPGQRLVIVTKDGDTIERDMRTVRRVTVENNQVVVVTRDGRTIRHPLANVTRMAIEPGPSSSSQ